MCAAREARAKEDDAALPSTMFVRISAHGVTVKDLSSAAVELDQRGIGTIGCYVVEGVRDAKNQMLDEFLDFSVKSVNEITEGGKEGHFALKLTAYISTDLMEKLSLAQERFVKEVLEVKFDAKNNSVLTDD